MFETRSEAWERVGLSMEVNQREVKSAQRQTIVLLPLLIGVYIVYQNIGAIVGKSFSAGNYPTFHPHRPPTLGPGPYHSIVQIVVVLALLVLGWAVARAVGQAAGPTFMRRMDPSTAGTVGFLIRLLTVVIVLIVAIHVAGVQSKTLAVGGAFTAVVVGLAAQQTLGNMFAGMVLLSARSFRVGDRVRLQAGALGGPIEGIVSSLGLLYTTLTRGADQIMVPNNQVLAAVVVPLREPDSVDVKVRLSSGVRPTRVQAILDQEISIPTRNPPSVVLEEVDGDDVVVRVQATPDAPDQGAKLADQIILALATVTGEHETTGGNGTASGDRNRGAGGSRPHDGSGDGDRGASGDRAEERRFGGPVAGERARWPGGG